MYKKAQVEISSFFYKKSVVLEKLNKKIVENTKKYEQKTKFGWYGITKYWAEKTEKILKKAKKAKKNKKRKNK